MDANLNHWSVTVAVDGDDVLTISHNHLAGKDGLDDLAPAIRTAAAHLLCFIGAGKDIVGGNVSLAHSDAVQAPQGVVLPDGSGFFTASLPLPKDHWLYAPRCAEWDEARDTTTDTPHPILTHAQRDAVVAAIRYAIRGATMCGKESDFDPDALVQNAVYALCGPYGFDLPCDTAAPVAPAAAAPITRDAFYQALRAALKLHRRDNPPRYLNAEQADASDDDFASAMADHHAQGAAQ